MLHSHKSHDPKCTTGHRVHGSDWRRCHESLQELPSRWEDCMGCALHDTRCHCSGTFGPGTAMVSGRTTAAESGLTQLDESSNEQECKDGGQILDGTPKAQSYGRHETSLRGHASSMKQKGCAGDRYAAWCIGGPCNTFSFLRAESWLMSCQHVCHSLVENGRC